jgi:hypothetical protein
MATTLLFIAWLPLISVNHVKAVAVGSGLNEELRRPHHTLLQEVHGDFLKNPLHKAPPYSLSCGLLR